MQTLYRKALLKWGEGKQLDMIVEEASELIKAVQKFKRDPNARTALGTHGIVEELADMEIMIGQAKLMELNQPKGDVITTLAKFRQEKSDNLLQCINLAEKYQNPCPSCGAEDYQGQNCYECEAIRFRRQIHTLEHDNSILKWNNDNLNAKNARLEQIVSEGELHLNELFDHAINLVEDLCDLDNENLIDLDRGTWENDCLPIIQAKPDKIQQSKAIMKFQANLSDGTKDFDAEPKSIATQIHEFKIY